MNVSPEFVDRIVQEVVKRLVAHAASGDAAPAKTGASANGNNAGGAYAIGAASSLPSAAETNGVLRLTERVIAWKGLEDRLKGIKTLEVAPHAVLTPLVRDLLKERRIRIEIARPERPARPNSGGEIAVRSNSSATPALWIGCDTETGEERPHHVRALVADVEKEFLPEKTVLDQSFAAVSQTFSCKGAGRTLRLWLTDRMAQAVCDANRQAHVRATWGSDVDEALRNVKDLRPNVLILPPAKFSSWQIRQVVAAWLRSSS